MTNEEKVKAYDKALERAKVFKKHLLEINDEGYANEIDCIFPELVESEGEKMRKELIENFKWYSVNSPETIKWGRDDNLLVKDIIAWLEKQSEQKPVEENKGNIEKISSNWSEEDEKMLTSIIEDVMPCGECPDYPTDEERKYFYEGNRKVAWLKSLKLKYNWRPTDEQLDALDKVYKTHGADCECRHILLGLLNDLKKL